MLTQPSERSLPGGHRHSGRASGRRAERLHRNCPICEVARSIHAARTRSSHLQRHAKSIHATRVAELSVPGNARYILHPVSSGSAEPNWFVESVNAPRSVYQAKKTRVLAVVAGANTGETASDVTLALNGKTLETKKVKLAPSGRATVEFFLPDAAYGLNRGEIRLASHDKLPDDDHMYFSLDRKEPGRILFVHEGRQPRGAFYYRAALDSGADAGLTTDAITPDQAAGLALQKYSFVRLIRCGNAAGNFEQSLLRYVQGGGSVLIALGPAAALHPRVPIFDQPIVDAGYSNRAGDRFQTAVGVDAGPSRAEPRKRV